MFHHVQLEVNSNQGLTSRGFPDSSVGKESTCKAADPGSIPVLGRYTGEGIGYPFSILTWRISWTEEPGRLQSMGWQRVGHD